MDFERFRGKRICVALSGGADSVALLHYLKERATAFSFTLSAVNCEHGIRGKASLDDTRFAKSLCERLGVPILLFSEDCLAKAKREKLSLETAAREFRYGTFEKLLADNACDYIALGHHADDEAETVLFRLCRGSSLTGAGAMREISGRYIRPFLTKTKAEILAYCEGHGLEFCTDESNFDPFATRNRLRLEVLPLLEELVPGAKENLCRFAEQARADDEYLYSLAERHVIERGNGEFALPVNLEKPLFYRACLSVLKRLGVDRDYTRKNLDRAYALTGLQTGAVADLKGGVTAKREYDKIVIFTESEEISFCEPFRKGEFDGGRVAFTVSETPVRGVGKTLSFDGEKAVDAVFRFAKEGDVFRKFGGGTKSLKKYLVDKKIPARERARLPVLARGNEILLIVGVEISETLRITDQTKEILYLEIKETE